MKKTDTIHAEQGAVTIIYDGECPICRVFIDQTVKNSGDAEITCTDARRLNDDDLKHLRHESGASLDVSQIDINEGIIVIEQARWYQSDAALHRLSDRSTRRHNTLYALLMGGFFGSKKRARLSYPMMRGLRNALLKALGKQPIELSRQPDSPRGDEQQNQ